jgi:hypothetical protein
MDMMVKPKAEGYSLPGVQEELVKAIQATGNHGSFDKRRTTHYL